MPNNSRQGILRLFFSCGIIVLPFLLLGISDASRPTFIRPTTNTRTAATTMTTNKDSGVLGELKETIRNQQNEIEKLRNQLKQKTTTKGSSAASAVSHGGHGGGGEISEEEIVMSPQEDAGDAILSSPKDGAKLKK